MQTIPVLAPLSIHAGLERPAFVYGARVAVMLNEPFRDEELDKRVLRGPKDPKDDAKADCSIAYFVTPRAIMDRFDQVVGNANWWSSKIDIESAGSQILIRQTIGIRGAGEQVGLGINDSRKNTDMYGAAATAFRRAAIQFGPGRYLYAMKAIKTTEPCRAFRGTWYPVNKRVEMGKYPQFAAVSGLRLVIRELQHLTRSTEVPVLQAELKQRFGIESLEGFLRDHGESAMFLLASTIARLTDIEAESRFGNSALGSGSDLVPAILQPA